MDPMHLVVGVVLAGVLIVTWIGIRGGARTSHTLEGWIVSDRGMGPVMTWFLLGTEVYTAFTFLGLAGFAYARGGGVFYNVATNDVGYALGFLLLPAIWLIGRRFGYVTQSDFIAGRYQSPKLGVFVALCTALIMIAYVDLNIEGLGSVLSVLLGGRIDLTTAEALGFVILTLAVFFGGIRGNAIQSAVKDILMFLSIATLLVLVPAHYFGGFGRMFERLMTEIPDRITMPGPTHRLGLSWFVTTVLLTGFGQWMWPQWFNVAYTGRGPRTLKLQAVFMPFYQLVKVAVITIGFAAILIFAGRNVPGNDVMMLLAKDLFPPWFLAIFALAAVLSAIVPAGPIVMVSSTLLARNVYAKLRPGTSGRTVFALSRWLVFPITLLALLLALVAHSLIVVILLVAYDFIAQLLPGVLIGGILWRRATGQGVFAGLLFGWVACAILHLMGYEQVFGMATGFVVLIGNFIVFFVVSLMTQPVEKAVLDRFFRTIYSHDPVTPGPVG
ncbi:MAG: sodium:solute symporter family protein [Acidisphaera sp.]|nr:sodium:solute symporter family protein [Acidisphaera sp.]